MSSHRGREALETRHQWQEDGTTRFSFCKLQRLRAHPGHRLSSLLCRHRHHFVEEKTRHQYQEDGTKLRRLRAHPGHRLSSLSSLLCTHRRHFVEEKLWKHGTNAKKAAPSFGGFGGSGPTLAIGYRLCFAHIAATSWKNCLETRHQCQEDGTTPFSFWKLRRLRAIGYRPCFAHIAATSWKRSFGNTAPMERRRHHMVLGCTGPTQAIGYRPCFADIAGILATSSSSLNTSSPLSRVLLVLRVSRGTSLRTNRLDNMACDLLQAPPLASGPHVWAVPLPSMQKTGATSLPGGRHPSNTPCCPKLAVPLAIKASIFQDNIFCNEVAPEMLNMLSSHDVNQSSAGSSGNLSRCRHGHAKILEASVLDLLEGKFLATAPHLVEDPSDRWKLDHLRGARTADHFALCEHPLVGILGSSARHSSPHQGDRAVCRLVDFTQRANPRLASFLNGCQDIRMRAQLPSFPCSSDIALELAWLQLDKGALPQFRWCT